jgi:hypothetical protein
LTDGRNYSKMGHRPFSEADIFTNVIEFPGIYGSRNFIAFFTAVPKLT